MTKDKTPKEKIGHVVKKRLEIMDVDSCRDTAEGTKHDVNKGRKQSDVITQDKTANRR